VTNPIGKIEIAYRPVDFFLTIFRALSLYLY